MRITRLVDLVLACAVALGAVGEGCGAASLPPRFCLTVVAALAFPPRLLTPAASGGFLRRSGLLLAWLLRLVCTWFSCWPLIGHNSKYLRIIGLCEFGAKIFNASAVRRRPFKDPPTNFALPYIPRGSRSYPDLSMRGALCRDTATELLEEAVRQPGSRQAHLRIRRAQWTRLCQLGGTSRTTSAYV